MFPGIAFRGVGKEQRAWVIGTALDVWQIVDAHRDIGSIERMAEGGSANERQIRLALDYYELSRGDRRGHSRKPAADRATRKGISVHNRQPCRGVKRASDAL